MVKLDEQTHADEGRSMKEERWKSKTGNRLLRTRFEGPSQYRKSLIPFGMSKIQVFHCSVSLPSTGSYHQNVVAFSFAWTPPCESAAEFSVRISACLAGGVDAVKELPSPKKSIQSTCKVPSKFL